jgi:catechol 2,3-dioxygenase-like lactoylglutathione lyase family enzyme
MIEITRDQLELGVVTHDHPAMMRFYGEALGLELVGSLPIASIGVRHKFRLGANSIKLIELDVPLERRPKGGLPWQAAGLRYWTIHVRDLDGVMARLAAAGTEQLTAIDEPVPGIRYVIVADPDGNGIELVEEA